MSTTYRIDLDRLNRQKVITYFHYVNFYSGYASLASAALALRWIGVPHLMPDWMTRKLRMAGLLGDDGELRFTVPEDKIAAPYGPTYGFPLDGSEQPNIVTVNLASLNTLDAAATFRTPVSEPTSHDHMTALRSVLDILGLPFPAWAVRRGLRQGSFTNMFPPAISMDDVEAEEFCDDLGIGPIGGRASLASAHG
jgi:hypothetical protein